jgi:hypothetical protein
VTHTHNNFSSVSQKGSDLTSSDFADSSLDMTRGNFYKRQKIMGCDEDEFFF